jgi:hypothetical protein
MITTILTCYRRPEYLKEQVQAVKSQTSSNANDEIWLWVNDHKDNKGFDFKSLKVNKIIQCNSNFKFHGRFAAACLVKTPFISILDDDTIPGINWYKNCMTIEEKELSLLGGVGLVFTGAKYWEHTREGWPSQNELVKEVDLVGHAWFFPRVFMRYFWLDTFSLDNCEDLQISYNIRKYANARVLCPPHPAADKSMWSSLTAKEKGEDSKASSNGGIPQNVFYSERDTAISIALQNGWKTINNIKI